MASILLAEDDHAMRNFLTKALTKDGHDVTSCEDGAQAHAALQADPTSFDLLLTDVVMPGMDGFELSQIAQRLVPDIKVMYITGFSGTAAEKPDPERAQYIKMMSKPFHLGDLVAQVNLLLEK